jgi:hypothetical protein
MYCTDTKLHGTTQQQQQQQQQRIFLEVPPLLTFEVFMAVAMKNAIFWDVTPCGSC